VVLVAGEYPIWGATRSHLFAFTATYFFSWKKVGKNRLLPHTAPALRSGVPSRRRLPGLRGLRLAAQVYFSRLRRDAEGRCAPGPYRRLCSASWGRDGWWLGYCALRSKGKSKSGSGWGF